MRQNKTQRKLLASAGNENQILALITRFYCGTMVRLVEIVPKQWAIYNSSGRIENVEVKLSKGRYRFEAIIQPELGVSL